MRTHLVVGAFTPSVLLSVARATGRLDELDLEVDEVPVASSPGQFRALLGSEIDVAFTSPDNVLAYRFGPTNPLGELADVSIVSTVDRGTGLALYGRPGLGGPEQLRGARVGVDVPTSGFALAMYALTAALGVPPGDYELVALGSTPRRLEALLAGECDATMLNAGNELFAEQAGAVRLGRVVDVCAPYVGTVLCVDGDRRLADARTLATALRRAAEDICAGRVEETAVAQAESRLGLPSELARQYVDRLRSPDEGLILAKDADLAGLRTIVELRREHLAADRYGGGDGDDVLAAALDPSSGLLAPGTSAS